MGAQPAAAGSAVKRKSKSAQAAADPVTPVRQAAALDESGFRRTQEKGRAKPRPRLRPSIDLDAPYAGGGLVLGQDAPQAPATQVSLEPAPSGQGLRTRPNLEYGSLEFDRPAGEYDDVLDDTNPLNRLMALGKRPKVVRASRPLQCVPFARNKSGVEIFGNANRWWDLARGKYRRTRAPEVGAVLVMNGYRTTRRGHVAVVSKIVDDRTIVVDHANWLNDGKIYLNAPVRDVSGTGDWSRVRVWYTPGQQWGQRIYSAKGFILPENKLASIGYR